MSTTSHNEPEIQTHPFSPPQTTPKNTKLVYCWSTVCASPVHVDGSCRCLSGSYIGLYLYKQPLVTAHNTSISSRMRKTKKELTCEGGERRYQRRPWVVGRLLLLRVHPQVLPRVCFVTTYAKAGRVKKLLQHKGVPRVKTGVFVKAQTNAGTEQQRNSYRRRIYEYFVI